MDVKQNRRTSDTLRRALVTVDSLVTVSTPSLDVNQETHSHLQRRGSTRTTSMVSSSDTSLHKLASFGYVDELVKRLPKTSNDELNAADEMDRTILHLAVENRQEAIVQLLVDLKSRGSERSSRFGSSKVNVDATRKDNKKRTALYLAVQTKTKSLVELVLQLSVDTVNVPGPNDRTPLHVAVLDSEQNIVKLLLQHGADPLAKDREGSTPVGMAVRFGSLLLVDIFFSYRTDSGLPVAEMLESVSGPTHSSLLHLAVEGSKVDIVVYLLSRGISRRTKNGLGLTAAHIACCKGNVPVLHQLVYADPWLCNAANDSGLTPVHKAAEYDNVDALKFLHSKGASLSRQTLNGVSPLLIASGFGSSNVVQELLFCGVDYMETDECGMNVLQYAVGHTTTLDVLMKVLQDKPGFDKLISAKDIRGATALHHAAQFGQKKSVSLLVDYGASFDAVDKNGATALHLAAGRGHVGIVKLLSSFAPRLIHAVDGCGRTPLHIACVYGRENIVRTLITDGATLTMDRDGRTAFHCAAFSGCLDSMKVLLANFPIIEESSIDVNSPDIEKTTALHLAVAKNHPEVVEFLLDYGATITDDYIGQNCLDLAIDLELPDCCFAIVKHKRWEETMQHYKKTAKGKSKSTQLQRMVETMPEVARTVMDRCVTTTTYKTTVKRNFNFTYMLGITDSLSHIHAKASVRLLKAMVKLNNTALLSHPLCVEFLNSKWRKFGAAIVVGNIAMYLVFLLLLMTVVIFFPAYSSHPLEHHHYLERLQDILHGVQKDNRTSLNDSEMQLFCYDNQALRIALLVTTLICLLKELIPMWYRGPAYFMTLPNVCEMAVYTMTMFLLDPFHLYFHDFDIPNEPCPTLIWEVTAVTVFMSWLVMLFNIRRLPHIGTYIVMMLSMVKTMLQFIVVVSLFVLGFGLAFYMLLNNNPSFSNGGLSMMKVVLMVVGDLDYDSVLPARVSREHEHINALYETLRSHFSEFLFIRNLANATVHDEHGNTLLSCAANQSATPGDDVGLILPPLSYIIFFLFTLLMPIVVLNTLIGLAVGDIATIKEQAGLRRIRMQIKLLIDLESALPSWFLNRVQVIHSSHSSKDENTFRSWVVRATKAAEEPAADQQQSFLHLQLNEVKLNLSLLEDWLGDIETTMDNHLMLVKKLAECVKHIQLKEVPSIAEGRQHLTSSVSSTIDIEQSVRSKLETVGEDRDEV